METNAGGRINQAFEPPIDYHQDPEETEQRSRRKSAKNDIRKHIEMNQFDITQDELSSDDGEETENLGFFSYALEGDNQVAKAVRGFQKGHGWEKWHRLAFSLFLLAAYIGYVIAVIVIYTQPQDDEYWCSGDGLLYILSALIFTGLFYFNIVKRFLPRTKIYTKGIKPGWKAVSKLMENRILLVCALILVFGGVVAFYIVDTADQRERLVSFLGLFFLVGFAYVFSYAPRKVVWRFTIWGLSIQFLLALVVLRWPMGNKILQCLSNKVSQFLAYANEGAQFVFGFLSSSRGPFAFTVLPVTIFFSFFTNLLYYYGVIQWIVVKLGWLIQVTVGTSLCESMNAAGSIFLGQTEAPLLVKPYLAIMTNSEIHAVMTAGYATIAGGVLAAYTNMGADPALLITASFMNAPAALAFSKLFYPNLRKTRISATTVEAIKSPEVNALHAGCVGVTNAIPLVANIAANLIAFISFIAFINAVFGWACDLVNIEEGTCSIEGIFGYIFMPLAWMMGVQWSDCYEVGQLLGLKIAVNEFVAYSQLMEFADAGAISDRSVAIATFALCGFGNLSSVGIVMGGLGPLAPARKDDMAKIAFRAMIAGSIATFSSACIAGTLLTYSTIEGGFTTAAIANTTVIPLTQAYL